jgi:hypothetical protein
MADHPQGLDLSREQALLVVCSTQVPLSFIFILFRMRVTTPPDVRSCGANPCLRTAENAGRAWAAGAVS